MARVNDPLLVSEYHFRLGLTHYFLGERDRAERAAALALDQGERAGDGADRPGDADRLSGDRPLSELGMPGAGGG